jgi:CubicO group peptidase (beta-lactamase class C family)
MTTTINEAQRPAFETVRGDKAREEARTSLRVRAQISGWLTLIPLALVAQEPQKTSSTSTVAEDLARQMLKVINNGDPAEGRQFGLTRCSDHFLKETPIDELLDFFQKARAQSGGLEIARVLTPEMPGQANFLLRTRSGNHFVRLVAFEKDGKLSDLFPLPATDPAGDISDDWPTNKVSTAQIRKEIERHAEFAAARDVFSGVVLVANGSKVLLQKAYGMGEKSFSSPNRLDTKFNLASLDKMFTGVAIGQLVSAGKLTFDDTIAKVLPEYPNHEIAARVTIHQLLTHTSGMGDALKPEMRERKKKFRTPRDYFPLFVNDPLQFEPGSGWYYSNAGFVLLGAIIEKVSSQSYFDYVRDHILVPAGMTNTGYFELDQVVPNLAIGYARFDDDVLGIGPRRNNGVFLGYKGNSAGGGYSTAPDLLRFARALRDGRLLNREMTEKVTAGKVDAAGDRYGYGFWNWTHFSGHDVRGNSGGGPGSGIDSELHIIWDGPYTVVVLSNYDPPGATTLARNITAFLARQL